MTKRATLSIPSAHFCKGSAHSLYVSIFYVISSSFYLSPPPLENHCRTPLPSTSATSLRSTPLVCQHLPTPNPNFKLIICQIYVITLLVCEFDCELVYLLDLSFLTLDCELRIFYLK